MKRFGIRQTVTVLTLFPLLVIVISMEFFFLHSRFSDMDDNLLQQGKLIAHQLASSSEYGVFSNNKAFLQSIVNGALQQDNVSSAVIQNANSVVLANAEASNAGANGAHSPRPVSAMDAESKVDLLTPVRMDKDSIWIYQPIIPAQVDLEELGMLSTVPNLGAIIIKMSRADTERRKSQMLWFAILVTTMLLVFPIYAIFLASRNITRPIRKLSDAVLQIAKGNLGAKISISSNIDELTDLASGINQMTTQLQYDRDALHQQVEEATQALRVKKEEAERASHDKSRFLAIASHDLRQPLHALGLYVAELQREVTGTDQKHLALQIENSIESLSTLLNALLDISKLDAGVVVPHLQTCDVHAVLNRISSDYQMLARIKNIRLVIHSYDGYITSDPLLLERILMNLVSNAIRYTHQHGCVLIACRRRGRFLRIEVRDNGNGIAQADRENIFREFFQLSHPHFDAQKGLGLGLAIVDRLVKLLGHRIELRSAPGHGSVFAVEVVMAKLPVTAHKRAAFEPLYNSASEIERNPLSGKRMLVVDDDKIVLSSTASVLASWGCIADIAGSLDQVEQLLQAGRSWDLLISDYQLGNNTSGLDVIAMVRRFHNNAIPCILISGDTSPIVLKLATASGYHLLHKPVRPAKLRSLLTYLVQGGTAN